jgi:hypothetical protein
MRRVALHDHRYGQGAGCSSDPGEFPLIPATGLARNARQKRTRHKGAFMLDIVMLAMGLGFFVLAIGYTYACERL